MEGRKVIIAGSRSIEDYSKVEEAVEESGFDISEVVSGTADGVDKLGEEYADRNGIPVTRFPADWKNQGKKAGVVRNQEMVEYADALIAVWDGESSGTEDVIGRAKSEGLRVHVKRTDQQKTL